MFYKLLNIDHNQLIDVAESPSFYQQSAASAQITPCSPSIANAVSMNGHFYKLQGPNTSGGAQYAIQPITEEEYNILKSTLTHEKPAVTPFLARVRERKIKELCEACSAAITAGISLNINNVKHSFTFTQEDQLNIGRLMNIQLANNASNVLYHSTGNKVQYYTAKDFAKLYKAMNRHINYHTTYFNLLKNCINTMYNPAEIKSIKYGDPLIDPADIELLKQLRR